MGTAVAQPPDLLAAAGLLVVQSRTGLAFRPFSEVALCMDEIEGRLTVVFSDGTVAHRPGPLSSDLVPGLLPLQAGVLAAPRAAVRRAGRLRFPGGWVFPAVELGRKPERSGAGTSREAGGHEEVRSAPPPLPELAVEKRPAHAFWRGTVRAGRQKLEVSRLRAIDSYMMESSRTTAYRIKLDDGSAFSISGKAGPALAKRLGLANLYRLEPQSDKHRAMYRLGLRDFPAEILFMPTRELEAIFSKDERMCIANLIWEAARRRGRGEALDYGTEYRGFYYRPVLAVLSRLGFLEEPGAAEALAFAGEEVLDAVETGMEALAEFRDPHYALYGRILAEMVGRDRLITLRGLGFVDMRPDLRSLGTAHPDVLIVTEKSSLETETRQVGAAFGVSTVILGGMARWEAAEATVDMLRPVLRGRRVRIVTYGDYDPEGWEIDDVFVSMLARYGIGADIVGRIVVPKRFTARELRMIAEPIPPRDSLREKWMKRTRGVHGKPLRIHADHLRPVERVMAAFREESGLEPLA